MKSEPSFVFITRMSVTNFQVLFEFVNENLIINTKLTITADAKTTVVVSSEKSAVVSVSRDNASADRFVPTDARRNIRVLLCSLARGCQTLCQGVSKCLETFAPSICGLPFESMKG